MYGDACRTSGSWGASDWRENDAAEIDKWAPPKKEREAFQQPSASYSKRSSVIGDLRAKFLQAAKSADDYIIAPTQRAMESAELFINRLPEGCLDFRIALSQSGEVNFFNGKDDDLFQLLIDSDGMISYYGVMDGKDLGESDLRPEEFPYMKLLQIVDRHK